MICGKLWVLSRLLTFPYPPFLFFGAKRNTTAGLVKSFPYLLFSFSLFFSVKRNTTAGLFEGIPSNSPSTPARD